MEIPSYDVCQIVDMDPGHAPRFLQILGIKADDDSIGEIALELHKRGKLTLRPPVNELNLETVINSTSPKNLATTRALVQSLGYDSTTRCEVMLSMARYMNTLIAAAPGPTVTELPGLEPGILMNLPIDPALTPRITTASGRELADETVWANINANNVVDPTIGQDYRSEYFQLTSSGNGEYFNPAPALWEQLREIRRFRPPVIVLVISTITIDISSVKVDTIENLDKIMKNLIAAIGWRSDLTGVTPEEIKEMVFKLLAATRNMPSFKIVKFVTLARLDRAKPGAMEETARLISREIRQRAETGMGELSLSREQTHRLARMEEAREESKLVVKTIVGKHKFKPTGSSDDINQLNLELLYKGEVDRVKLSGYKPAGNVNLITKTQVGGKDYILPYKVNIYGIAGSPMWLVRLNEEDLNAGRIILPSLKDGISKLIAKPKD
uniref:Uncharacterized protein n=1 Tax=Pithovirus LCPAC103 TaxID=2506588 RepID=A0A481Z5U5_9VIRU|nr:MAG: hypothetical protein LCPAC103_01600 [Pithovirus LCPAC103]